MRFQRSKLSQAVASVVAASAASAGAVHAAEIEEIVVTATKRAESMEDIPVAMNALTGDSIEEMGVSNFDEYAQFLTNVVASGRGPGQRELYVRGAATEQSSITITSVQGSAPAVALYQDEQPVSFAGRNLDVYATDLERIEVLPGPQGTLFGASSQTGTVRMITNKPRVDGFDAGFDATVSTTKGGEPGTAVTGFLNLPLTDRLAFRIAAYNDRAGGWIDNDFGTYQGNIEVMNRNAIFGARICSGSAEDPAECNGRGNMAVADNSTLVEKDFNEAVYSGARLGLSYLINDDWDVLLQHTNQTLKTEGVFEYDPVLEGESSVNRFAPSRNQDEFGLTTWTLTGRVGALDLIYTGGFLDRDVFYTQDYTGYTNGGGYQHYYMCRWTGAPNSYSSYADCFDPTKQYLGNTTNKRFTNEFRINTDASKRWQVTAGVFIDDQKTTSDGQFQYLGMVEAGFYTASAPGTVTEPPNSAPASDNIVSTVEGVTNPYGRGPATTFVNSFTRKEDQIAFFGQFGFDITEAVSFTIGARHYDIDYEFLGSTGSSFGCKSFTLRDGPGSEVVLPDEPCDGQGFDNRVTNRLDALGQFSKSGDPADLAEFSGFSDAEIAAIESGTADGSFYVGGFKRNGVINQKDTIWRATLSWNMSDNVMLFGGYAEGFRPQTANRNAGKLANNQTPGSVYEGYLVPAIAKTDQLENYEIGLKGSFLERTLSVNATAYTTDITDLQISRFDPANVAFLVFIENAGDAEVNGLDLDFTWLAGNRWTIQGGLSLVDNKLSRINPQLEEIVVPEGSRLPWTPEVRANLRARYDFPINSIEADGWIRAAIVYTGSSRALSTCNAYFVEDVTTQVFGVGSGLKIKEEGGFCGTPLAGDDLTSVTDPGFIGVDDDGNTRFKAARYVQEDFTLVDLAAGVRRDDWTAELFINNLFNEHAQINVNAVDY
ncbi:MAG: TonB-dependent receptor, partial [Gammaproteobacteria bacterium]